MNNDRHPILESTSGGNLTNQPPSDQKSSWLSLDYYTRLVAHSEHWFAAHGIPDSSPRVEANKRPSALMTPSWFEPAIQSGLNRLCKVHQEIHHSVTDSFIQGPSKN